MKKILVIENRLSAKVFNKMLKYLPPETEIGWIVFNKIFFEKEFRSNIKYNISHSDFEKDSKQEDDLEYLSRSKRYFNIDINYTFYKNQFKKIIDDFKPDIVIGESTQFYELLIIKECIIRKIPYINPMSTRYPTDCFEFYLYDTDYPLSYLGKKSVLSEDELKTTYKKISENEIAPSYMNNNKKTVGFNYLKKKVSYYLKISYSRLMYESVITPSFQKKFELWKRSKLNILKLNKYYTHLDCLPVDRPFILYAMQYQPENNLDVRGYKYSDQTYVIDRLSQIANRFGFNVVVKLNPLVKYQITTGIVNLAKTREGLFFVSNQTSIKKLLLNCSCVVSATGTILIEAAARKLPVFALVDSRMTDIIKIPVLDEIESLEEFLKNKIVKHDFIKNYEVFEYLIQVALTSFKGNIYNPLNNENNEINDNKIASALSDVCLNLDKMWFPILSKFGKNLQSKLRSYEHD